MSQPGQFAPGKLLDFFRFFDPKNPQHVEGVRRLIRSMEDKAPELLNDNAYWVQGWRTQRPKPKPITLVDVSVRAKVKPLSQNHGDSCGQTAVAMAINALAGKHFIDDTVNARYGLGLLAALNAETGWQYWDNGDIGPDQWDDIELCLQRGGVPIAAGNGPGFSSGAGHIMCIVALHGDKVTVADPNGGYFRDVTRRQWEQAARHPQGNFLFLCKK